MRLSCVEDYGGEIVVTLMGTPGQKRLRYPIGEASNSATSMHQQNFSRLESEI